jgi:hypothetical protein
MARRRQTPELPRAQTGFLGQAPGGGGELPPGDRSYQYPIRGLPFNVAGPPPPGKKSKPKVPKAKTLPPELEIEGAASNLAFQNATGDTSLVFCPQELGFLPSKYWLTGDVSFGDLVTKFFQRKNNANCRFPHKLYNALALVDRRPSLFNLVGVRWVNDRVFLVDKFILGRLLGINAIDGGLFHSQGNFPSHGFVELVGQELEQVKTRFCLAEVDQDRMRLLYHKPNMFSKNTNEDSVSHCKWIAENGLRV